ncbi:DDE-type integrase/transposase/recombinase [Nocardia yunnanensis]|uniref:DDE-type integrase/transposase/recombinase n=1 Tax=Nocardia yunnanensis TaxID=2382165 RepID=UPI0013C4339B|nr:DDE-type integrase/transposase/recombinase [Nocardia yunnanensis]
MASDLLPGRSSGGRGGERLSGEVEAIVRRVLRSRYLSRQRRSVAVICREIDRECRMAGLRPPSRSVARRIGKLDPVKATTARDGQNAARSLRAAGGAARPVEGLLERVQMDHTPADVIVVDEFHRLPIGRPYVTAAIDEATWCVPGFVVTLEAPSATSVGLCLAHMAIDKRARLERLGVAAVWPMSGKPREMYVDNASEFKSEALRRGSEQHGHRCAVPAVGAAAYRWGDRAAGRHHDDGPRTARDDVSDTRSRRDYDSDAKAVLTLAELQRWMALAVACYHGEPHEGLGGRTPGGVWAEKVAAQGAPPTVTNETAFLVDFLPVERRSLRRTGFVLDHVQYDSDALKPLIACRDGLGKVVLRPPEWNSWPAFP